MSNYLHKMVDFTCYLLTCIGFIANWDNLKGIVLLIAGLTASIFQIVNHFSNIKKSRQEEKNMMLEQKKLEEEIKKMQDESNNDNISD